MEYGSIPEILKAKQGTGRKYKISKQFPSEVPVPQVTCKRDPHSMEKFLRECAQLPKQITQAAQSIATNGHTSMAGRLPFLNVQEDGWGSSLEYIILAILVKLVKTYLWLEYKPSNLTLQRSEQVRVPPADFIFSPHVVGIHDLWREGIACADRAVPCAAACSKTGVEAIL